MVTGFLGCGKTTLIGRLLPDPRLSDTAVIVNEFGEVALDHALIASSTESFIQLTTGCLCCAVRTDLVRTLLELEGRREAGEIAFARGFPDQAQFSRAFRARFGISPSEARGRR